MSRSAVMIIILYTLFLQGVSKRFLWPNRDYKTKENRREKQIGYQVFETKIVQNSNKTNSKLCLKNMGVERKYNSETVGFREENSKKNIRAHKRKSTTEN